MSSCEDEVSTSLFKYFSESLTFEVLHWHPPGGKQYFTRQLRIPVIDHSIRAGRMMIDLIVSSNHRLFLIECKCKLSEAEPSDIPKLRSVRDEVGLERLLVLFANQGADVTGIRSLVLGIGFQVLDSQIPDDFFGVVPYHDSSSFAFGSGIDQTTKETLISSQRQNSSP